MAQGPTRFSFCGEWERGRDCSWNERHFYYVVAAFWSLTALIILARVCPLCHNAPRGYARSCLILTAISATFNVADAILYLDLGQPRNSKAGYRHQPLVFAGSIFMVFALTLAARAWCDVAGALQRFIPQYKNSEDPRHICMQRVLGVVRTAYTLLLFFHIPVAVVRAMAGQRYELVGLDASILAWTVWCFLSACCGLTFLAILMWWVATKWLRHAPDSKGLKQMTWVNLTEQVMYNICLGIVAMLYFSDAYSDYGIVQATYYVLYTALYWMMHAQVLVFFMVVKPNDPLYNEVEFTNLMSLTTPTASPSPDKPNKFVPVIPAWQDNTKNVEVSTVVVRAPS